MTREETENQLVEQRTQAKAVVDMMKLNLKSAKGYLAEIEEKLTELRV